VTFLEFCRAANVLLGVLTAFSLGALLYIGWHRGQIKFVMLFAEFVAAMILVALGSKSALSHNSATSPYTGLWTALLIAINLTCLYYAKKDTL
jgi:hypothetical protein